MSARPDLSALSDKEILDLSDALWDMRALIARLLTSGVMTEDDFDLDRANDLLSGELKLRLAMRRAVQQSERHD